MEKRETDVMKFSIFGFLISENGLSIPLLKNSILGYFFNFQIL
jgi:hypothetical protein